MDKQEVQKPLENALNHHKGASATKFTADKKQAYAEGLKVLKESDIINKALQVGDTAFNFELQNATGDTITLYDELEKSTVILMWYRGGWCPYCNLALQHMQQSLPEFKKLGVNLLAISPEMPDSSISTKEKQHLQFEVLSDVNNLVAHNYKLVHSLTDDVREIYEDGFGLSTYNGNSKGELPLAATYIIGQDKKIKYAYLDADYRNRAEPKDLIKFLESLK